MKHSQPNPLAPSTQTLPRHARCRVAVLAALAALPGVDPVACETWLTYCSDDDERERGPIVDVADLMSALTVWSRTGIRDALARLEDELLVVDRSMHRGRRMLRERSLIRDAWAVQLTPEGLRAARVQTVAPPRSPEVILAELRSALASATPEQRARDLAALRALDDENGGAA